MALSNDEPFFAAGKKPGGIDNAGGREILRGDLIIIAAVRYCNLLFYGKKPYFCIFYYSP